MKEGREGRQVIGEFRRRYSAFPSTGKHLKHKEQIAICETSCLRCHAVAKSISDNLVFYFLPRVIFWITGHEDRNEARGPTKDV